MSELPVWDEETTQKFRTQVRQYNEWVTKVVPIVRQALADARIEDEARGRKQDRTANLVTFTAGMFVQSQQAEGGDEVWGYDMILGQLCAALVQLADADNTVAMLDGNRRCVIS
jgi:hypothetical protein